MKKCGCVSLLLSAVVASDKLLLVLFLFLLRVSFSFSFGNVHFHSFGLLVLGGGVRLGSVFGST